MFDNKREFNIASPSGDLFLVEIEEHHGAISLAIGGDFKIELDIESAFDLVDGLTMVANNVDSHYGEE